MLMAMPPLPALLAASLVVFFEVVSFGAIFPVLADYCKQLGGDAMWVGLLFAMVAGPRVVMNTVWGKLSDRIGRKPVLLIMTGGTLVGSVLWALSPVLGATMFGGLAWLAISRIACGLFQAQAALTQAIAADVSTNEKRTAAMGLLGAAFGLGIVAGISMGGFVGSTISYAAVGWCSAVAQVLSLGVIAFGLRETHPAHQAEAAPTAMFQPSTFTGLLQQPPLRHLLIIWLIAVIGQMVMVPTLRLISADRFDFTLADTTWLFIMWAMIGVFIQGGLIRVLIRHVAERSLLVAGLAITSGGMLVVGLTTSLSAFWVGMAAVSAGMGLATPTLSAMLSHRVNESDQGAAQGLNQSVTALGRAISYGMAGWLYAQFLPGVTYAVGGAICAVAVVGLLLIVSPRTRSEFHGV